MVKKISHGFHELIRIFIFSFVLIRGKNILGSGLSRLGVKAKDIAMKLAEALVLRADKKKRIEQLKQRIIRNAKVQEGEKPAENPETLIQEMERISQELVVLIQRINKTNSITEIEKGVSIADAIASRDILVLKHSIYRDIAQAATVTQDIRTKSEVKFKGTVKVSQIQEIADLMAKNHRELDTRIQEMNWKTELL
jgi:hypothetical protein